MLEFIVLGQIPGTHIEISFRALLFVMAVGLASFEFGYILFRHKQAKQAAAQSSQTAS